MGNRIKLAATRRRKAGSIFKRQLDWYRPYLDETNWAKSYDMTTSLINSRQLGLGVELGTAYGWGAEQILLRCPQAQVISVDAYSPAVPNGTIKHYRGGRYEKTMREMLTLMAPYSDRFAFIRAMTVEAADMVPDNLDWVYVDASHDDASLTADLTAWFPKLKRPGGLLMGHDYGNLGHPDVKPAVDRFLASKGLKVAGVRHLVWWVDLWS